MEIGIAVFSALFIFCFFYILLYQSIRKKILVDKRINNLVSKEIKGEKEDAGKSKNGKEHRKARFGNKLAAKLEA